LGRILAVASRAVSRAALPRLCECLARLVYACIVSAVAIVSLVISLAALSVSVVTLLTKQRQDRRDLFLKMHERLVDPDLQQGRRILRERIKSVEDAQAMRKEDQVSYQLVGRALAMFDILGGYVLRKYVDEELVLEEWGHTYAGSWASGRYVILERTASERERLTWSAWPHLQAFGKRASAWASDNPRGISEQ
jgi:hypothetical protein